MSYILEALKKSERERRLGQVPSLPALELDGPPKRSRWALWLALLCLLLSANAGVLVYLWLQGRFAPQPAPNLAAAPTPMPTQPAMTPAPKLEAKLLELEKRLAELNQAAPAPSSQPAVAVPSQPARAARVPTPKPRHEPVAASEGEPEDVAPRPLPRRKVAEPAELPADEDLPKAIRALKINVLAYSDNPAERFAVINMARHVPGDRLPGGVVLVDILPNGLSLELDGSRYRIDH